MSINKVICSGNLTRDPELRTTPSGTSVLSFGIAVNDRRLNQQTQEWEDKPNFVDCTMFGKRAESLANYLAKGAKVAIEGKLDWHQWQDRQTGQNRSKLDVIVNELEFMSRRDDQPRAAVPCPQARPAAPTPVAPSAYDEELPF